MNVGMLWYDGERSLAVPDRIRRAADYYASKYGAQPTLCLVNSRLGTEGMPRRIGEMEIRASRSVLEHHFWIGVRERES